MKYPCNNTPPRQRASGTQSCQCLWNRKTVANSARPPVGAALGTIVKAALIYMCSIPSYSGCNDMLSINPSFWRPFCVLSGSVLLKRVDLYD